MGRLVTAALLTVVLAACTSVGTNKRSVVATGGDQDIRLCVWLGKGVPERVAAHLVDEWNANEGKRFGLHASYRIEGELAVASVGGPWFIKAHTYIPQGCDRNIALNGRQLHNLAMEGLTFALAPLPVMGAKLGASTPSHMVITAEFGSLFHVAVPPAEAFRHEMQHLLGCGHDGEKACLSAIAETKSARTGEFLPVRFPLSKRDQKKHGTHVVADRDEWNRILHSALWASGT